MQVLVVAAVPHRRHPVEQPRVKLFHGPGQHLGKGRVPTSSWGGSVRELLRGGVDHLDAHRLHPAHRRGPRRVFDPLAVHVQHDLDGRVRLEVLLDRLPGIDVSLPVMGPVVHPGRVDDADAVHVPELFRQCPADTGNPGVGIVVDVVAGIGPGSGGTVTYDSDVWLWTMRTRGSFPQSMARTGANRAGTGSLSCRERTSAEGASVLRASAAGPASGRPSPPAPPPAGAAPAFPFSPALAARGGPECLPESAHVSRTGDLRPATSASRKLRGEVKSYPVAARTQAKSGLSPSPTPSSPAFAAGRTLWTSLFAVSPSTVAGRPQPAARRRPPGASPRPAAPRGRPTSSPPRSTIRRRPRAPARPGRRRPALRRPGCPRPRPGEAGTVPVCRRVRSETHRWTAPSRAMYMGAVLPV